MGKCSCSSCAQCKKCGDSKELENFNIRLSSEQDFVIALAGNPNVGKSTVFNQLTGLKQHTGNWPGKTVVNARGSFKYEEQKFVLVDLPGTYSLLANSVEEEIARDFICFGKPDATVVILDATCLQRNLNLLLQVMELTDNVVACVNLMDEAKKKGIKIDIKLLEQELGIPVVATSARDGKGLDELISKVYGIASGKVKPNAYKIKYSDDMERYINELSSELDIILDGKMNSKWVALRLLDGDKTIIDSIYKFLYKGNIDLMSLSSEVNKYRHLDIRDSIVSHIYSRSEQIYKNVVKKDITKRYKLDKKLDDILTSRIFGFPIMILLLASILWITITGANYPSQMIADFLFGIEEKLTEFFMAVNSPKWLHGILILGMYRTMAWVIAVMLPPMAIFFPLFTLLEDFGYLPRVALNLDRLFKRAGAHGKQSLTMCMGFGCNAAGVTACRIIDSPRERLIAIITNNFVPCNGRFPTLIAIATIFVGGAVASQFSSIVATLFVTLLVILGIVVTLIVSKFLTKTFLKGVPSSFTLELPSYRRPQIGRVIYTSLIDRTIFVLARAVAIALPAGIVTWILANIMVGDQSVLLHAVSFLDPFARVIGMDGYILMAFILGLPANEIVIPILIMAYMQKGAMLELDSLLEMKQLFINNGWTFITALNVMIFSLLHFPCGTTLYTIKKETGSNKWTFVSFLLPTIIAVVVCFLITQFSNIIGLI